MKSGYRLLLIGVLLAPSAAAASAFEPPLFPLDEAQIKAFDAYARAKGDKAFAAGPDGRYSAQIGYASLSVAVARALKACDAAAGEPVKRCVVIDLNGTAVPAALQLAQSSRADPAALERPILLGDFALDADAWAAMRDYADKPEHKAFAISLKGPWARSWEQPSLEEAQKQALETCNKRELAGDAPCFIIARDGERVDPRGLAAGPDLAPVKQP